MPAFFDHERLNVHQEAVRFVVWIAVGVNEDPSIYGDNIVTEEKEHEKE